MDSFKNISDFELLLQKQSFIKPSFLYNKDVSPNAQTYKPQDVIKTVCSQVKALQLADCARSGKSGKDLTEGKKSNFLPLNRLPVYRSSMQEVPKVNPQKFETQCFLDTQLLNIMDGAAPIDTNTGMTQEFETTFIHTDGINRENTDETRHVNVENKSKLLLEEHSKKITKIGPRTKEIDTIINRVETDKLSKIDRNIAVQNFDDCVDINTKEHSQISKAAMEDTVTFIENLPFTQEANEELEGLISSSKEITLDKSTCLTEIKIDIGQDTSRSPSPVLKTNAINRKLKTPSPLVVSLETFENFENVALSLIEENDFETAKHLINSQILGKELCFNDDTGVVLGIERDKSPVLEFKSDELQINSNDLIPVTSANKVVLFQNIEDVTLKRSEVLKDEILFSSDEEDCDHKESQNLPLTCALETSNDVTDILEKSMYVGFQTASNKYIQISRDSYEQAQSIFSSDEAKAIEEFSLTELVEKCDKSKPQNRKSTPEKALEDCNIKAVKRKSITDNFENRLGKEQEYEENKVCSEQIKTYVASSNKSTNIFATEKQSFNGFVTASNKKIDMSHKALERCQTVFKDIDLNENFNAVEVSDNTDFAVNINRHFDSTDKKISNNVNAEEFTDDKINDDLLLEEFENIEMSLEEKQCNRGYDDNIAFNCLKTATTKTVTISKEAAAKSENVFRENGKVLDDVEINTETDKKIKTVIDTNQLSTSKADFVGFKTANNKEIKISEEAMAKSKDVFKDIGKDKHKIKSIKDIISQPSTSSTIFVGFKTANNKDIKISNEALSKTKNIFKDMDKEQTRVGTCIDGNRSLTSKDVLEGLGKARSEQISELALFEFKNVFNDIAEEMFVQCENEELEPTFKGFKTASGKQETIYDQIVEKSKNLFRDILIEGEDDSNSTNNISKNTGDTNKSTTCGFVGFKTANNKPVNISAEALHQSHKIFSNLATVDSVDKAQFCTDKNTDGNFVFKDFQTASKKPVTVSTDALAKCKRIFKDIDEANDIMPEKISKNLKVDFTGFHTGNEKPVEVCNESLNQNKILFNDSNYQVNNPRNYFVGFKTASNRNVNISNEALVKCKKIFDDIEDIPITAEQHAKLNSEEYILKGFQTADKKKLEISKEALEKTRNLFEDINTFGKKDAEKPFLGFQTANNNKVIVSEQALAKSRQLFQDPDDEDTESDINVNVPNKDNASLHDNATDKNPTKAILGFKTGSNKEIKISEDALKKSRKLFAETGKVHSPVDKKTKLSEDVETKKDLANIDKYLDTQVINDFDEDVCTEDFKDTSRPYKRSGSPILVCPKAKKRKKFETPYKTNPKIDTDLDKDREITKPASMVTFKEEYKKNKRLTLRDLNDLEKGKSTNIDEYILDFNLENILKFQFDEGRNDFQKGKMAIDDIKQVFTEATDKKLIPDGWLDIHLKLILWKLISYEIRFPTALGNVCTVRNVIDQLKYRYDKELYNAERSVLRKILEKDDVPNKTMVLCVAGIYADGVSVVSATNLNNIELLLTDGWYFIKATIDNMLSKLVYDGRIIVGSKIVTCGAELVNCEQGMAPWEDTSSVRLSISGNSTRPALWDDKLGLRPATMVSRLASVRLGGGRVARLRVRVVRVYPRLYVEKFQDGSTVTRSERLEHQYQMKHEAEREAMIEKIYEEVEKEISDQDSQDSDGIPDPSNKRKCYESGSQIAKMMKTSKDPMEFRAQLTSSQIHQLQEHVIKQRDKYLQAIQDRVRERLQARNVVTLARGRIVGVEINGDRVTVTKGMLSIWKPNEEVLDIFKEGSWIEVSNVVPTAFRNSEIQLSAGRQSLFRPVKCNEDIFKPHLTSLSRTCHSLKDLSQSPSRTTDYNEIDTVGIIFAIEPTNRDFDSNRNQFQNAYLADIDKNMICVNFWGGIKKFGYENVLDTGQVIYCGNLQKRAGNTRKNIPQFRATEFAIFTKTPINAKGREMVDETNKKLFGLDRRKFCEDCVAVKQNYSIIKCLNDSENVSPYRFNTTDYNLSKNKLFIETPVGVKVKNKADDFNLTGLDFESTFKQQDTQLSPKALERRKKINEKIARLKMYGEPPPLTPLNIINKSKNATNSFKSPLLKNEDDKSNTISAASVNKLECVATPTKLPDDNVKIDGRQNQESSPIISNITMNRTYVKRNINPVKLSFSENVNDKIDRNDRIDHFAEEFDGSPPLSLE